MRICFVIGGLCHGGAERRAVNIMNSFVDKSDLEVFVVTGKKQPEEYELSNRIRRFEILRGKNIYINTINLKKIVRNCEIDVVIGFGIFTNLIVSLLSLYSKVRTILVETNDPQHDSLSSLTRLLRFLLYRFSDNYIFQTEGEKDYYSKSIQKRSIVISNPVRSNLPSRENLKREIVAIGRLTYQKNYQLLLDAFKIIHKTKSDYILRIFGDGPDMEKLRAIVNDANLTNYVVFEGFKTNIYQEIINSDIYVITSRYEGLPNSLLEAMAMGFPVVSTDFGGGGARQLIQNGINGIIVDDKPADIAESIIDLVNNPHHKELLGKNAIKVRESNSFEKISEMWYNYLKQI